MREGREGGGKGPLISTNQSLTLATGNGQVLISGGGSVVNCLPAELYHKSTLTNQDVNSNHLVITASEPSEITQQTERLEP